MTATVPGHAWILVSWAATALGPAASALAGGPAGLQPRVEIVKPPHVELLSHHRDDVITVKFLDDAPIRLRDGALSDFGTGTLVEATDVLTAVAGGRWIRMDAPEDKLDEMRASAQQQLGRVLPDFNTRYHLVLPDHADAVSVIDALNALNIVELAAPAPIAPPSPAPGNFGDVQGYLNAGPVGLNALAAWEHLGTRGLFAQIVDIEYDYNAQHQDLPSVTQIGPPTDPNIPLNEINHGTAVLGVLGAVDDGIGTTGMAPDASLGFATVQTFGIWDVANAVTTAAAWTPPGTIILIEQQWFGPNFNAADPNCPGQFGMVPVEWRPDAYNAIVTAVANGYVVVEAAGNGAENLDSGVYLVDDPNTAMVENHQPFTPANDSGAIIVGAGSPTFIFGGSDLDRSRLFCSNYGSRVDVQGWGEDIRTTGYGDWYWADGTNQYYTSNFGGTSGASAMVAGAAALLQSANKLATGGPVGAVLTPAQVRQELINAGEPQLAGTFPVSQNIGPRPDAAFAIRNVLGSCLPMYDTAIGNQGLDDTVSDLIVHDDGSGDLLYAAGRFTTAGGASANGVATFNGTSWAPVGNQIFGDVYVLAEFGGDLYAGGSHLYDDPNAAPNNLLARWDGSSWSAIPGGMGPASGSFLEVYALADFNDGNGDALYLGGGFTSVNGITVNGIAKWDGSSWSALGSGIGGSTYARVFTMAVFNDGNGDALYVGGDFLTAGGNSAHCIAKWDGSSWSTLGAGFISPVTSLVVYDDGNGDALFAGGQFLGPGSPYNGVAKWDGSTWSTLGVGQYTNGVFSLVGELAVHNDGTGDALYVGGSFHGAEGTWANRVAKWDGTRWWPLADGVLGDVSAMVSFDEGDGPDLYIGGAFLAAYDLPTERIVKWTGCAPPAPPCPADLDGNGLVNTVDFFALLAAWGTNPGGPPDLDGNNTVDVVDLFALLAAWGPCP